MSGSSNHDRGSTTALVLTYAGRGMALATGTAHDGRSTRRVEVRTSDSGGHSTTFHTKG